ncbi:hypothetical protein [Paenibacillus cymbidii]|uniref:hypothetical protein n=1 Tax=Paenibacillus cymbidii TaxID=1639034 RepID=UPI001081FD2F|nr:hypothetical protein [Paenibacillus cymbidii]
MDKKTFDALFKRSFATAVKREYAVYQTERADNSSLSWDAVRKQMETNHAIDSINRTGTTEGSYYA